MTKEQAEAIVEAWVKEWRLYLDGGLHFKARNALVAMMTNTAEPKRRGRPPRPVDATIPIGE